MRKLLILTVLLAGMIGSATAQAHLVRPFPRNISSETRKTIIKGNLKHVSYVCRRSTIRAVKRPHCRGARWLRRELAKVQARLQPISNPVGAMASGIATWYGPGFYGHSTSCGQILTTGSMWAASMRHGCGTPVTICTHRCISTTIQDTGAFSATFDLAPGLARALGCYCTQSVRYRIGG